MSFYTFINIFGINLPLYLVVYTPICLIFLYILYSEGVKDGFDKEKLFDIFFSNILLIAVIFYIVDYLWKYTQFYNQYKHEILIGIFLLINLVLIRYFTYRLKWSIYRIFDIFSILYFCLYIPVFVLNIINDFKFYKIAVLVFYIFFYLFIYVNKNRIFSSISFCTVLLMTTSVGMFIVNDYKHLIFYFSLITISMVTLIFRSRKKMFNKNINIDFLNKIKELLKSKSKRLEAEQQKLIEEDPYLMEGRDLGNSEEMDEAILEDRAKEEIDIKKEGIEDMQKQVDKALDKIEAGEYGVCEKCGNPIDKARLTAYPEATTCLDCAHDENE